MDKFIEYAPWLIVAFMFFKQNKMFVTPEQMAEKFDEYDKEVEKKLEKFVEYDKEVEKKLEKYVLKETYNVTTSEIKSDVSDIKSKVDKIYDKLISG